MQIGESCYNSISDGLLVNYIYITRGDKMDFELSYSLGRTFKTPINAILYIFNMVGLQKHVNRDHTVFSINFISAAEKGWVLAQLK